MSTDTELSKDLGLPAALTIGAGTMIGAGIFVLPATAASEAGPAAALAFVVAGFIALFTALSISELGTAMPKAGGGYYYINDAMGPLYGSITGWGNWLGLAFATAFYMIGFGTYANDLVMEFGYEIPSLLFLNSAQVAAILAGLIFIGINYYGAKETGTLQVIIVGILLIVLTVFSIAGFMNADYSNLRPFFPEDTGGTTAVLPAAGLIFVTYLGFAEINTVAEELKNPGRNLPLAVIGSLLFVIALYAVVMLLLLSVEPYDQIVEYGESAIADVGRTMLGPAGFALLIFGGLLATASSANASILASSRINFAMGRDKIITDEINEIHSKFQTPYRSIAITGALIILFIGIGDIEILAKAGSILHLIVYGLLNIALIVYRETDQPEYDPDFTVPFYPIVPALGAILSFGLIGFMAPAEIGMSIAFVIFGIVWYFYYAKDNAESVSLVGDAIAPEPELDEAGEDVYRVVVPISNPDTQQDLLRYAAASANTHTEAEIPELVAVNAIQVPSQTSLQQRIDYEEERLDRQQQLLESAREAAQDMNVSFRTRAIVGRDVSQIILNVVEEEAADQVLLGWEGTRSRREYVVGSVIDPIVTNAPCDVTLLKRSQRNVGTPVALAGPGPHAPVAARRAYEFATIEGTRPTLVNVQQPPDEEAVEDGETAPDPVSRGEAMIAEIADRAGLEPEEYDAEVIVDDDISSAILETVQSYETVCVGVSEKRTVTKALFGSIAQRVGEQAPGNVAMVRGPYETHRTVREAIAERLAR